MTTYGKAYSLKWLKLKNLSELDIWFDDDFIKTASNTVFKFPLVKLKQVLQLQRDFIKINDNISYKRCRVQFYSKGIEVRDIIKGNEIITKRQQVCKENQLLVAEIDAKLGGYGIVPKSLDGAIVSSHYFLYSINKEKLLPSFLELYLKTEEFHKQIKPIGSTNYAAIRSYHVLEYQIPLPPLSVQEKLVNEYQNKIKKAYKTELKTELIKTVTAKYLLDILGLNIQQEKEKEFFKLQKVRFKEISEWGVNKILFSRIFSSNKYILTNLKETNAIIEVFRGKNPQYKEDGKAIILNQKCNRWNEIYLEYAKPIDEKWFLLIDKKFKTVENDIIINSTGEGTLGRSSLITKRFENLIYDSHILLLRLDHNKIIPLFWVYLFNSIFIQQQINQIKSAQSTKQTELGLENLYKIRFPLPPLSLQNEIIFHINAQEIKMKNLQLEASQLRRNATVNFENEIFKN